MAVHVKLVNFQPVNGGILWPAPSVRDYEHFRQAMSLDTVPPFQSPEDMLMRPLRVLCDYRGTLLYTEGEVQIFRCAPRAEWYNGIAIFPQLDTTEDCRMYVGGVEYLGKFTFV